MHKLFEYLCDELKDIEKKVESGQTLSMNELEYADKLTEIKKNLLKIEMLEDGSEYSHARKGMRRYSMDDDRSYARRGRYSRAEDDFMMDLHRLMEDAPDDHKRQKIQKLINEM